MGLQFLFQFRQQRWPKLQHSAVDAVGCNEARKSLFGVLHRTWKVDPNPGSALL